MVQKSLESGIRNLVEVRKRCVIENYRPVMADKFLTEKIDLSLSHHTKKLIFLC
ncbi:hypothetical protein CBNA_1486 [Coxiella burnetii str. Namibia]|nr:hypothetical protein CBNA_1486 [Coxiella burnetii str. Namibia]